MNDAQAGSPSVAGFAMGSATDTAITVAGETLVLLPERAAWWPRARTLLVADVHLGKSATFRRHGLPVPAGSTDENLGRLDACLQRYPARRLLCLGDLTHAAAGHTDRLLARLAAWRGQHPGLAIELVRGNHDRHAGVPATLQLQVHDDVLAEPPFLFCHDLHEPQLRAPQLHAPLLRDPAPTRDGYRLAGHVHPGVLLEAHGDKLRLPCFLFGEREGLLPAFGAFTGLHVVSPGNGDACYPVTPERVFGPLPVQGVRP
ncbi:ligase-associated DNA damage response endonuclease PdeM [Uliginosibacterium sp. H1]|uniref:ligase-associated DNA damage response endonuclease PdeM n=1 Tax=Uliginosibacterium sp. H1 TaxID=3114757 RepID=UPI002E18172F|nr:ligase-associated DNA damage response endonuclease PdeM [Uliginosibacterium sp. H1]